MRRAMTNIAVTPGALPLVGEVGPHNPQSAPRRAGALALPDAATALHRTKPHVGRTMRNAYAVTGVLTDAVVDRY